MSETNRPEPGPLTDAQIAYMKHDVGGTHLMYSAACEVERLRSQLSADRLAREAVEKKLAYERENIDGVLSLVDEQARIFNVTVEGTLGQKITALASRIQLRAESAESLLASVTKERDGWKESYYKCCGRVSELFLKQRETESILAERTEQLKKAEDWATRQNNLRLESESRATAQALAAAGLREALEHTGRVVRGVFADYRSRSCSDANCVDPLCGDQKQRIECDEKNILDALALSKFPATPDEAVRAITDEEQSALNWAMATPLDAIADVLDGTGNDHYATELRELDKRLARLTAKEQKP